MKFRLVLAAVAMLLSAYTAFSVVLPSWQLSRSEALAQAIPGQLVRHGASLVEVVDQGDVYTVVRVVMTRDKGAILLPALGISAVGFIGLVGLGWIRPRRIVVEAEEEEEGHSFSYARFGFEGHRMEITEEEEARLYGDLADDGGCDSPSA